jgi:hypothetical protein
VSGLPRLRAPREHGAVLCEPPLGEVGALLALNRERLRRLDRPILSRPFQEVRHQARQELWTAARDYLSSAGEPIAPFPPAPPDTLLMAGHQPELFHPGVWLKNFALCGLARRHGGGAVNLIVDNDAARSASLTVPQVHLPLPPIDEFRPHTEPVPFDRIPLGIPHEEWLVRDEDLFSTLPERARRAWGFVPFLDVFWAEARRRAAQTPLMASRLTGARRAFERRWGCHNLEVNVSDVSRTEAFAWFVGDLLAHLSRFHAIYNGCVHDHRKTHGLKSRNHPVPDLAHDGDWLEAPLWAWRSGNVQRKRLFARRTTDGLALRAGEEEWPLLPFRDRDDGSALVSTLSRLEGQGFKVRPRALSNTLFIRLFVADLFLHGIGGGKYDELTDEIARRYYGSEPPRYLVVSGTLLLPFPSYAVREDDCRRLARLERDLYWNPQRYLQPGPGVDPITADLLAQRLDWMTRNPQDEKARRRRWRTLQSLTEQLRPAVEDQRRRTREQLSRCQEELKANAVLKRRDYAFCLYPEAELRDFCTRVLSLQT